MMSTKNIKNFNPLLFLLSLGAGGIAVAPFAFLQYVFYEGPGLVTHSAIHMMIASNLQHVLFMSLEILMILFATIHIIATVVLAKKLVLWLREKQHISYLQNPLTNAGILAPFISLVMTMNVFIGPLRYFIPIISQNLQQLMLPALLFWSIIWIVLMKLDLRLLKISFEKPFDVNKISFGWLLHPFALGMLSVTGMGIAAMSHMPTIAHVAAFMSVISASMAAFLLLVKLVAIFKSHFAQQSLPEKQFLPSFLIVVPNITLLALSAFRFAHYVQHNFAFELEGLMFFILLLAFAFETWYLLFGATLLKDYFKRHFFKKEFYITQWGLVCPVVAYAVLGSFLFAYFVQSDVLFGAILVTIFLAVVLFFLLLIRQLRCVKGSRKVTCQ
ncbi:MAG: selenoprotein TsoY [Candidatus Nanoarchaeia archaeon]